MNDTKVRLQNLRDFTVQIRDANDRIVGTGIAVSTDGRIVTCAHVVQAAGIDPRNSNGAEIGVYFPQLRGGEEKDRKAIVEKFFPKHDDDIVLLQLSGAASPLSPEQIAVLGTADKSEGNPFRIYGFSPIGVYPASRADGKILGSILAPLGRSLQVDPIELESRQVDEGMSGSAVLDTSRNLVVGLIAERYYSTTPVKDDISFGVDSMVLTFDPFDFEVSGEALELRAAPEPKLEKDIYTQAIEFARLAIKERESADKYSWNSAPAVLTEWTGRDDLLKQITEDWNNLQKHVTGLIGFGGEGKSSLARKWVDTLISPLPRGEGLGVRSNPDGIFWWGFYENRSVDEFLEAALKYMSGGRIDPRQVQSSNLRAQIIGAMLGAGRYLFVLDGLEVMQHQEGDQSGLLQSNDLRDLLTFFARPDNSSFCLVTSRAPLLSLMEYTTYTHRDVDRLSDEDGRALLRRLGVKGSDAELNKVVADWDGHALTLSILAAYLAERYEGDIKHLADIPVPTANEPRYERVHRVLRRYDEHLTKEEQEFLKLFSVFRLPVKESAFEKVFEPLLKQKDIVARLFGSKTDPRISNIVNRLVSYRIIRHDEREKSYTTHPLIRNHYFALFTKDDPSKEKAAHEQIKDYYLSITGDTPQYPTLDDLKPLIEIVHHACEAGAYDDAWEIYWERISKQQLYILIHQLSVYETELQLMIEFFPAKNSEEEPQVSNDGNKAYILHVIGLCFLNLGRLSDAVPFYKRAVTRFLERQAWRNAGSSYQNLAELHASLGALEASAEAARQALDLARRAEDKDNECLSLSHIARTSHLLGETDLASRTFKQAETLERQIHPSISHLSRVRGINYVDHLRRIGNRGYARSVAEANLNLCVSNHWTFLVGMCHRVLGDLDSDAGNHESARAHYESALKIARSISKRDVLIEALLARGRWQAKHFKNSNVAFNELNEALGYCVESGYRIYEADVRVALGWAYLADLTPDPPSALLRDASRSPERKGEILAKAKAEAERALQMSNEMGYHWGKVDAKEVLERIESR